MQLLDSQVDKGLVTCRPHPTLPLLIWNYTEECAFRRLWDDVNRQTRGLVTSQAKDGFYEVLARGFDKFFNVGESDHFTTDGSYEPIPLPAEPPTHLLEKLDGSLGICFLYDTTGNGDFVPVWSTRGAFETVQSQSAVRIMAEKYPANLINKHLPVGTTLLVEIISSETTMVVPYDFEDVRVLGLRRVDGTEYTYPQVVDWCNQSGLTPAKQFDPTDLDTLVARAMNMDASEEGFVCLWARPGGYTRAKIKSLGYVSVHRIVGGKSERAVGDRWYAEKFDFLTILPKPTLDWANEVIHGLDAEVAELQVLAQEALAKADHTDRKSLAISLKAALANDKLGLFGVCMSSYLGTVVDYRLIAYKNRYGGKPRSVEAPQVAPGQELVD